MNEFTRVDEAMSSHVAARLDVLRFSETNLSSLDDGALKQLHSRFKAHIESMNDFILEIDEPEIFDRLVTTKQLIQQHYIIPIEAELVRRDAE